MSDLPDVEADWVHHSGLDDLHAGEHAPCHGDRLGGVTISQVLSSLETTGDRGWETTEERTWGWTSGGGREESKNFI